jgi:hypothetical protein
LWLFCSWLWALSEIHFKEAGNGVSLGRLTGRLTGWLRKTRQSHARQPIKRCIWLYPHVTNITTLHLLLENGYGARTLLLLSSRPLDTVLY